MSNSIAIKQQHVMTAADESELIGVLQTSLYPGAAIGSVKMVLGYCRAAGLDPMQKPVHIVPMWDKNSKSMRDVVLPGIGLYRTQAARSGQYAGVTEPEFGPDVIEKVGESQITFPAWCKVTVKRLLGAQIVEFSARELWKENYATAGKDSDSPNAVWKKRPYGQLAKCAEAQALRKAFPELGSAPTADEMEGKEFEINLAIDKSTGENKALSQLPPYPVDEFDKNLSVWLKAISVGKATADQIIGRSETKYTLTAQQKDAIRAPEADTEQSAIDADFVREMEQAEQ